MKKFEKPDRTTWPDLLKRPSQTVLDIEKTVLAIFEEVRQQGDLALYTNTKKFDGVKLTSLRVAGEDLLKAKNEVPDSLKKAIRAAKLNIEKFHRAQKTDTVRVETIEGVQCWQEKKPIQKVGLYIPGGTAPLFSTILMLAIPAQLAGCREVILCTPPGEDGRVHPAILYTAHLCGIQQLYRVGGIQAIAGMTWGTESIPKVYKIFGPGNQYVTVAKQIATKFGVAIDMPAGPSELLVVGDDSANPAFVASDLLSQAEHGEDSQVILVSASKGLIRAVEKEIAIQLEKLPRKQIAQKAMNNSKLILVENDEEAIDLINEYAPEHFIISSENEKFYTDRIVNAGSVFLGKYTPESAGDYASGTNHTLPTNGYARQYSGVNLDSFMKSITFQRISAKGIQNLGPTIERMAEAEGLQAHKNAVTLRLKSLINNG